MRDTLEIRPDSRVYTRYRLSWRFRRNGTEGSSAWVSDREIVQGWLDSLTHRTSAPAEHWIESERFDPREPWREALDRY